MTMNPYTFEIKGCINTTLQYAKHFVKALGARGVAKRREAAVKKGHKLAAAVKIGDWLAFDCKEDTQHHFWLAKAVRYQDTEGATHQFTDATTIGHTTFGTSEYLITVQWYERDPRDSTGRTFVEGEFNIADSSELGSPSLSLERVYAGSSLLTG